MQPPSGGLQLPGLDGRVAFVAGGARGVGRCIAETLDRQGAKVAVGDLVQPEIPGMFGVALDVTSQESVAGAVQEITQLVGPVEVLVCGTDILRAYPLADTSLTDWEQIVAVNLTGVFLLLREVMPDMAVRGYGRVVVIGSSAGKSGGPRDAAAYAAAKAGAIGLAKSLARDYASSGVTVNVVVPALVDTPRGLGGTGVAGQVPAGRLGRPQEVADVAAFLASEPASYVTGEVIDVNGGFVVD